MSSSASAYGLSLPRAIRLCWLVGLLWTSTPVLSAQDTPRQRLEEAINAYQHGGYLEASAELTSLLYPLKLTERRDIVRAKVYLGLSYYVLDRKDEAEEEFRGVFKIAPDYQPDPLYIPPDIIVFIERLRPPPPPPPRSTPVPGLGEKLPTSEAPLEAPRFSGFNLLPAGIPQFRHGDVGRGTLLLTSEASLLALNVGTYWYLKYFEESEPDSQAEYNLLVAAKAVNISSLALLAITVAAGAGDAIYRYRTPPSRARVHFDIVPGPDPRFLVGLEKRF